MWTNRPAGQPNENGKIEKAIGSAVLLLAFALLWAAMGLIGALGMSAAFLLGLIAGQRSKPN